MAGGEQIGSAAFAATAESVRNARRFVRTVLDEWAIEDAADLIILLTSELATNAVLHARSAYTVSVRRVGACVRVTVADDSPLRPQRRNYTATAGTGRGLAMVEDHSAAWGIDSTASGKEVWFEVPAGGDDDLVASGAWTDRGGTAITDDVVLDAGPLRFDESSGADDRRPRSLAGVGA